MLDFNTATPQQYLVFDRPSENRAIQDFEQAESGKWMIAQAHDSGAKEDARFTLFTAADASGTCKRLSEMLCVDAGHPTTFTTWKRAGTFGIVLNWGGVLGWAPYKPGVWLRDKAGFEPIFRGLGSLADIDHVQQTITFRNGNAYGMYEFDLDTGKVGGRVGVAHVTPKGVGQGFFTGKVDGQHVLVTPYGGTVASPKQVWDITSFATDKLLLRTSKWVIPGASHFEPQAGDVIYPNGPDADGVLVEGASTTFWGRKLPRAYKLTFPKAPTGTWVVQPSAAPFLWGVDHKTGALVKQRAPGYKITTGTAFVTAKDSQGKTRRWLLTAAGYRYCVDYLRKVS